MNKYLLSLAVMLFAACGSNPPIQKSRAHFVPSPLVTIYQASYNYTWESALKEMQRYPLSIVNKDAGVIKTDIISVISDRYETESVIRNMDPRSPVRYYIELNMRELAPEGSIPRTEVSIVKYITKLTQYGSGQPIKSDYLDERVITHRIKRLLEIERTKLERNRK